LHRHGGRLDRLVGRPGRPLAIWASALATASLPATALLSTAISSCSVAIAFLAGQGLDRGFHAFEISVLAAGFIVPLLSRAVAGVGGIPLGLLLVLLTLYAFTLRRALLDRASSARPQTSAGVI
jgi:hypothetical protein